MVQKKKEKDVFFTSALQAPSGEKLECLQTHAINDRTDDIEVRYFGINSSSHHHCPILVDTPCESCNYVHCIIEGYQYCYHQITQKIGDICENEKWWRIMSRSPCRTVVRDTVSYCYLLRKVQHPNGMISENHARDILFEHLGQTPYTNYEIADLLNLNIPYFYHIAGKRDFYDGNGGKYPFLFAQSAVEILKKQFFSRTKEKMDFDCEILSRHLSKS